MNCDEIKKQLHHGDIMVISGEGSVTEHLNFKPDEAAMGCEFEIDPAILAQYAPANCVHVDDVAQCRLLSRGGGNVAIQISWKVQYVRCVRWWADRVCPV